MPAANCVPQTVHLPSLPMVLAPSVFVWAQEKPQAHLLFTMV